MTSKMANVLEISYTTYPYVTMASVCFLEKYILSLARENEIILKKLMLFIRYWKSLETQKKYLQENKKKTSKGQICTPFFFKFLFHT